MDFADRFLIFLSFIDSNDWSEKKPVLWKKQNRRHRRDIWNIFRIVNNLLMLTNYKNSSGKR